MKKFLVAIILGIYMATSMAEPAKDTVCAPENADAIRYGYVNNDMWAYWWCRNSTDVWAVWTTWLNPELKNFLHAEASSFVVKPSGFYLSTKTWSAPVPLDANGIPEGRAHLWTACKAAIDVDTNKPLPGIPYSQPNKLAEIWIVTPNGANPTRKTSKVVNGTVQSYGSGTITAKIGALCDHTKPSYPIGSLTKYLPLREGPQDEVISCIKIQ